MPVPLELLLVAGGVFAINLLPAFGPPSWSVLVLCAVLFDLPVYALVAVGAPAAASGRYVLALGARHFRSRLSPERRASLEALRGYLEGRRHSAFAGLAVFALSPVPSAQLFVAAGVTGVRLVPLTLAFFTGRVVSYTIYAGAATLARDKAERAVEDGLTSPTGIALQVLMVVGVVALVRIDWAKLLSRRGADQTPTTSPDAGAARSGAPVDAATPSSCSAGAHPGPPNT